MEEQRKIFLAKAQEQKFDEKKSGELFDLMAYFAGYGFNKSHSAESFNFGPKIKNLMLRRSSCCLLLHKIIVKV